MATSSQPNINDALYAEKDRAFRAQTTAQLEQLIAAVITLTGEVQALKEVRPSPAPTFQAGETVKLPTEAKAESKKAKE